MYLYEPQLKIKEKNGTKVIVPVFPAFCSGDTRRDGAFVVGSDQKLRPFLEPPIGKVCELPNEANYGFKMDSYYRRMKSGFEFENAYTASHLYEDCCVENLKCQIPRPMSALWYFSNIDFENCVVHPPNDDEFDSDVPPLPPLPLPVLKITDEQSECVYTTEEDENRGHFVFTFRIEGNWNHLEIEATARYCVRWAGPNPPPQYQYIFFLFYAHQVNLDLNDYEPEDPDDVQIVVPLGCSHELFPDGYCSCFYSDDTLYVDLMGNQGYGQMIINKQFAKYYPLNKAKIECFDINVCPGYQNNSIIVEAATNRSLELTDKKSSCTQITRKVRLPYVSGYNYPEILFALSTDIWHIYVKGFAITTRLQSQDFILFYWDEASELSQGGSRKTSGQSFYSLFNAVDCGTSDMRGRKVGYGGRAVARQINVYGNGFLEEWSSSAVYNRADVVIEDGVLYCSIADNNIGNLPSESPDYWMLDNPYGD